MRVGCFGGSAEGGVFSKPSHSFAARTERGSYTFFLLLPRTGGGSYIFFLLLPCPEFSRHCPHRRTDTVAIIYKMGGASQVLFFLCCVE